MRGIEVKNESETATGGRGQTQVKVGSVEIQYNNGDTFTFVPEKDAEFFGQEELLMIADRLLNASQVMEWDEHNSQIGL